MFECSFLNWVVASSIPVAAKILTKLKKTKLASWRLPCVYMKKIDEITNISVAIFKTETITKTQ